jgi:hypothetical protein
MVTPALYVLALFLGLSLVVGVLVAVHDGIEYLLARRARVGARPASGCQGIDRRAAAGRTARARDLVVVSTESGPARAPSVHPDSVYQYQTGREQPAWLEAAGRDLANGNRPAQRPVRPADRRPRNRRVVAGETTTREAAPLVRNASGR